MEARLRPSAEAPAARSRLLALAPFAVLGAWTVLVTALLARIGLDNHHVFTDEVNAIMLGRGIALDHSLAFNGTVARGPERMTSLFAAVAATATDSPTRQLDLLHLWAAICQGLVTIPLWLAARQLGLDRWQSLVPALVVSAGSFAFYGIFTLHTSAALLCAALMLWAMLRALRRPGLASDLLVGASLALMTLTRIGWAPLVAALVPAALAATWFGRPADEPAGTWLRRLPGRLLRRHPLLTPIAAVLVVVAIAAGPSLLLGGQMYGGIRLTPHLYLSLVWDNTRTLGAHLAIGIAIVPLVLALPVIVRDLVRPANAVEGGFAWLVVGLLVVFSYAYYASMNEDRYFAVLAAPLVLAAALAVFRRPPPVWSVVASGVLVTALVVTSYRWPPRNVYDYFIAPTSRFFEDAVVRRLTVYLPDETTAIAIVVAAVAALAAVLVAVVARRSRAHGPLGVAAAGAVLAGVLLFQLAAMDHPARKFSQQQSLLGFPDRELEFIDRTVGDGATVRPLAVEGAVDPDLAAQLTFLRAFNTSIAGPITVAVAADPAAAPGAEITVDWRSGRIAGPASSPVIILQMADTPAVGFEGETLPASVHFPWAQLIRLREPLAASWLTRGLLADRYPEGGKPLVVRVYPHDRTDRCLRANVLAPPFLSTPHRYRLTGGPRPLRGVVKPGEPVALAVRIPDGRPHTFTLTGQPGTLEDGTTRGPTLANLRVGPCR